MDQKECRRSVQLIAATLQRRKGVVKTKPPNVTFEDWYIAMDAELKRIRPVYRDAVKWYRWYGNRCASTPADTLLATLFQSCARAERKKGKKNAQSQG